MPELVRSGAAVAVQIRMFCSPSAWLPSCRQVGDSGSGELLGCGAVADGELVEPAASRVSGWPVEAGDVRLEVVERCPVNEIDAREHDGLAGHLELVAQSVHVNCVWTGGTGSLYRIMSWGSRLALIRRSRR